MKKINSYLPWTLRIIIFILFILSGVAKMVPIWAFEKQLVDLEIVTWCQAPYFARLIIALELAIGIAILQPHFLKRIIIPITILLLVAFCIHLSIQMVQFGPMNGNCGCFGQLIPMTPLEAFIKNILTIGFLIYLYKHVHEKEKGQNKWIYPSVIFLAAVVFMFVAFPFKACSGESEASATAVTDTVLQQIIPHAPDSLQRKIMTEKPTAEVNENNTDSTKKITAKKDSVPAQHKTAEPKKVTSRFSKHPTFGDKTVNLDEGKKIICFFAAGCDHCRATAKEICSMSKGDQFPEVYIFFMDEETFLIEEFFKEAQCKFPYQILDIPEFWTQLGTGSTTPGVFYLWNGNIIKSYEGITERKFNGKELSKIIDKGMN
jgi:uncharacterized membrane protein YphA (DoxX/SURF4 family)